MTKGEYDKGYYGSIFVILQNIKFINNIMPNHSYDDSKLITIIFLLEII